MILFKLNREAGTGCQYYDRVEARVVVNSDLTRQKGLSYSPFRAVRQYSVGKRFSYASGESSRPLLGMTIGDALDLAALDHPNGLALASVHQKRRFTYEEFNLEVNRVALGLLELGLRKGDRVGIWSPNNVEWALTQFATAKIGVILVNINPAYRSSELLHALKHSGCTALVMAHGFKKSSYVDILKSIAPEIASPTTKTSKAPLEFSSLPQLRHIITISSPSNDDTHHLLPLGISFEELIKLGDVNLRSSNPNKEVHRIQKHLSFDDPINIQYTSGTTGLPKGVTLTHHNILNNGLFVGLRQNLSSADRICIAVPLYHCFGMVMGNLAAITSRAAMIYPCDVFDPEAVLQTVHTEKCTALYGVPTMFIAELAHPNFSKYNYSSLRTGIMAGAPCPVEVMSQVQSKMNMKEVTICYGMTETSPVSLQTKLDDPIAKRVETVGTVMPHLEVKIVDTKTGELTPRGEVGELCVRGYSVMRGYWNDEIATRKVLTEAHWMHTGDLGVMDVEGYVNIVGRSKDMIIRGGENISPREVEELLYAHPAILDVSVIGVPDSKYGEAVMAWVRLRPNIRSLSEEEVRSFCKERLAHFKVPKYVKFTDHFPTTVTGKIQKYLMREQSIKELKLEHHLRKTA